ncbi:diacylglycerol/lipid kinase family protein [Microbacterium sp.]|uniref:diacylglycerol/lipid kinase family protein n=1 Tax=Microbacterium sp. TaxID=51671 RepID=UPI002D78816B|nr:diacylglycerol kinase family protein [Microbacterium sp.]HET6302995.1 diacylglycerol kinase family protein [Microbacterium sp.]
MAAAVPEPSVVARGRGVLIVRNPRSGTAVLRIDPAELIAERLPEADVRELGEGDDLADIVDAAMRADAPPAVLGVYGGDGSVSRMAELARKHDRPLLVMPGGTFNHFARSAGIVDVATAIDALEGGSTVEVSAVEVTADDEPPILALNAVSIGAYPELIDERDRRRARLGKWLGGIVAAWIALRSAEPLAIVRDGRRARVWSVFIGVGRSDPKRVATMQREDLDDPTLDVRIHHARGTRMRAIASLAFGKRTAAVLHSLKLMPPRSDVERLVVPEFDMTVRTEPGRPSVYVHDGELEERAEGGFRLRCVIVPRAVTVYAREDGDASAG